MYKYKATPTKYQCSYLELGKWFQCYEENKHARISRETLGEGGSGTGETDAMIY